MLLPETFLRSSFSYIVSQLFSYIGTFTEFLLLSVGLPSLSFYPGMGTVVQPFIFCFLTQLRKFCVRK